MCLLSIVYQIIQKSVKLFLKFSQLLCVFFMQQFRLFFVQLAYIEYKCTACV